MSWHPLFKIDAGFTKARSPATAIARNPDHLDLFATGTDGGIYSAYWDEANQWSSWFRIDPGFALGRSAATAIARNPDHLDLFVTGTDGRIHSTYWDDACGWATWSPIDPGFTEGRSPVAAIARNPSHLDLFVTGGDGRIYSTYWDDACGWATWFPIDLGFLQGRSPVAVVARNPSHLDLFVTGTDGRIHSTYWDDACGWATWSPIDPGFTEGRSPVAAIARTPDHLDLFVTGTDGGVYSSYQDDADGWGSFFRIDEGFMGAPDVVAIARNPDHLDLFVVGTDGGIHSAYWDSASGWAPFFGIDDGFTTIAGTAVTAIARRPDHLDLFVAGTDASIHSTYWDPGAGVLRGVTITFDTHDDNKNEETIVDVFVKNRLNNSLSPEEHSDFVSNWAALQRYQPAGDLDDGSNNPYLAYGVGLGKDDEFEDPSSRTFALTLARPDISVNEVVLPVVNIHIMTDRGLVLGFDRWIFDFTVTLQFDTGSFSFTSAVDGVRGIILDQDNRTYSGIGIENPLRTLPIPVPTTAPTNALLKKVTLEFSTHDDNKDFDTVLSVHIVNRLSPISAQDIAIGLDLFKDEEFPDSGDQYRAFSWEAEEGQLASNSIRLADMVLPVVYIVIVPNGNDRWIFDYRVTFEFADTQDFGQKRRIYSSSTSGVILDQDNNKHAGVYQGRPFPTVTPPTAPALANQPVDHTGNNQKTISIAFLRRKFDEFINRRNDPLTGLHPPLARIHLGAAATGAEVPPESYADIQMLVNANDGKPRYITNPGSLGQLGKGWVYLSDIDSESIRLNVDAWSGAPLAVTVAFKPGGILGLPHIEPLTLYGFSMTLKLTLDKATLINQFGQESTVVDLMSWVTDLQTLQNNQIVDHVDALGTPYYRYIGSFLHQPVDLVSPQSDVASLYIDQVIILNLNTDSDAVDEIRRIIQDKILHKLIDPDVITKRSARDGINSQVTSWLLGGVADDERNPDENNCWINDIGIQNANPELGIPEDLLVINYRGPQNVFAPTAPTDWPTPKHPSPAYDFSPSTLANIDHIIVLTKENRSFDHMLGYLSLPHEQAGMERHDIDGLKGGESNPYQGIDYPVYPLDQTRFVPGPPNGHESVQHAINGSKMDGFVKSYAEANSDAVAGQVMGYHTGKTVPVYDALARDFAIGHRWFCSHPGPTFPNRFYELTGRPNLDARGFWEFENSSPMLPVFTPTIFDHLNGATDARSGAPVTWRYFEHGYCTLRFYEKYTFDHEHIVSIDDPVEGFFACARSGRLPSVSFIDPHFVDYPPGSSCDEPPSDIAPGQDLIQRIVEAVITSPTWPRTLLLIVYDEHGGFYDHVPPPAAARVSPEFPIGTLGLRVPAFVISPWVAPGSVFGHDGDQTNQIPPSRSGGQVAMTRHAGRGLHFDHTSILKTIARRFLSNNPPYMGARYAAANDLSAVVGTQLRQPQFLPFITYRLQFVQSQMMLNAIKLPYPDPGAVLWQLRAEGTEVQDFSFEDAGNGFVYIRSHVGNRYVTAHAPDVVITDVTTASPGAKWKLSHTSALVRDSNLFVISNHAYPNMVLQPANRMSGSPVVLGDASGSAGIHGGQPNAWKVSSPLLSDQHETKQ
jgi:phospholipase C